MSKERFFLLLSILGTAVSTLVFQLLAMLSLQPQAYGAFSAVYLFGSLFFSVQLSMVCEAWTRSERFYGIKKTWEEYSAASLWISLIAAALGALMSLLFEELRVFSIFVAFAIGCSVFRAGARFFSMRKGEWRYVVFGDVSSALISLIGVAAIFVTDIEDLVIVLITWTSTGVVAVALSRKPSMTSPTQLVVWVKSQRKAIRPLLRDSVVMDVSAIGTPYALMPFLGLVNFGIYRAVSSVAAPVRLIINPLRPQIANMSRKYMSSRGMLLGMGALALLFGAASWMGLLVVRRSSLSLGTLGAVSEYAVPTALFVMANFLGHTYYLFARQVSSSRAMLNARIVQTVLTTVGPLTGVFSFGINGAIWGFATMNLVSAFYWVWVVNAESSID